VDRGDTESFGSEGVGEVDADGRSTYGEMNDLAQRSVSEVFGRQCVVRLGDLLGGSPGRDPVGWGRGGMRLR